MRVLTTVAELTNTDWLKSGSGIGDQVKASDSLKEQAAGEITRFMELSSGVDAMECLQGFCQSKDYAGCDKIAEAKQFLDDLIAFFLKPEHATAFAKSQTRSSCELSDMLPSLAALFENLFNETAVASIQKDSVTRFSGSLQEAEAKSILSYYTWKRVMAEAGKNL